MRLHPLEGQRTLVTLSICCLSHRRKHPSQTSGSCSQSANFGKCCHGSISAQTLHTFSFGCFHTTTLEDFSGAFLLLFVSTVFFSLVPSWKISRNARIERCLNIKVEASVEARDGDSCITISTSEVSPSRISTSCPSDCFFGLDIVADCTKGTVSGDGVCSGPDVDAGC